ncbi:hypothetical protein ASC97_30960 [Rhizobium sp. Root1203]|nr:hypothetical protein ASC97_30960 [Rhizobium sp. Root1203]
MNDKPDGNEADDQNDQGRIAATCQHLVNRDPEKQRGDQREDLDDERGEQHVAEGVAVAQDRGGRNQGNSNAAPAAPGPTKRRCTRMKDRSGDVTLSLA